MGYTAFAIDLFGQGKLPQSIDENRQLTAALYADKDEFRRRLAGSLNQVSSIPGASERVVAMDYCFGGSADPVSGMDELATL